MTQAPVLSLEQINNSEYCTSFSLVLMMSTDSKTLHRLTYNSPEVPTRISQGHCYRCQATAPSPSYRAPQGHLQE